MQALSPNSNTPAITFFIYCSFVHRSRSLVQAPAVETASAGCLQINEIDPLLTPTLPPLGISHPLNVKAAGVINPRIVSITDSGLTPRSVFAIHLQLLHGAGKRINLFSVQILD